MSNDRLSRALEILGLTAGDSVEQLRTRYRELLHSTHPDVSNASDADATNATIALTDAYRVVLTSIEQNGGGIIPAPAPAPAPSASGAGSSTNDSCQHRQPAGPAEVIEIRSDGDTISMTVPPSEAFSILLDACAQIGGIGYVDRALGLLEVIVRFEGGPSCSVLVTMQGRAFGTDAFITMESIEADPTPPLAPVVDALLEEIEALGLA